MRRRSNIPSEAAAAYDGPSKSQVKREMLELQDLGAALLEMNDSTLDAIGMAEELRDALREHRRIPTLAAQRRQLSYVGKLLRLADLAPLQKAVEAHRQDRARETQSLKEAERWRERLIADDTALTAWLSAHPVGDTRQLRALIRNAREEQARSADTPPGQATHKGRHYRELFQLLREALVSQITASKES